METKTITLDQVGCHLDNHRGHYLTRDMIWLAEEYGFILSSMEKFTLEMYEAQGHADDYPMEELQELSGLALAWLNSGQSNCSRCHGTGKRKSLDEPDSWLDKDLVVRCKVCTGTGRGPREEGQNFPPILPDDYLWAWNDGDFGIYPLDDLTD
jgi:hypothetical protein